MENRTLRRGLALPEFSTGLVAYRAHSRNRITCIVDAARRMSKGGDFVVAIRDEKGVRERLVPAYINAMIRHDEGIMHSDSLALEIMMLVAKTMNIGRAIGIIGADDNRGFILFSNKKALVIGLAERHGISLAKEMSLGLDVRECADVALTAVRDGK